MIQSKIGGSQLVTMNIDKNKIPEVFKMAKKAGMDVSVYDPFKEDK